MRVPDSLVNPAEDSAHDIWYEADSADMLEQRDMAVMQELHRALVVETDEGLRAGAAGYPAPLRSLGSPSRAAAGRKYDARDARWRRARRARRVDVIATQRWPPRGVADVWRVPITQAAAAAATRKRECLCAAERRRADRFVRQADRDIYVTAHVGLRELLGSYVGTAPAALVIEPARCPGCGERHGAPTLPDAPSLRVSLSHASGLALVAVAIDPVGVDAEQRTAGGDRLDDMIGSLHPAERAAIGAYPPARRREAFLRCWVRKEAYLKGRGIGLGEEPDRSNVGLGDGEGATVLHDGWWLATVDASSDHFAAVALLLPAGHRAPRVVVRTHSPG